jgi:hypothetical protein
MIIPAPKYLNDDECSGGICFTTIEIAKAVDPQIKYVARYAIISFIFSLSSVI